MICLNSECSPASDGRIFGLSVNGIVHLFQSRSISTLPRKSKVAYNSRTECNHRLSCLSFFAFPRTSSQDKAGRLLSDLKVISNGYRTLTSTDTVLWAAKSILFEAYKDLSDSSMSCSEISLPAKCQTRPTPLLYT